MLGTRGLVGQWSTQHIGLENSHQADAAVDCKYVYSQEVDVSGVGRNRTAMRYATVRSKGGDGKREDKEKKVVDMVDEYGRTRSVLIYVGGDDRL